MKAIIGVVLSCLVVVGGCGGCLWAAYYFLGPTPPTAEQQAHYDKMAKKLAEAQPGDFVIFEDSYDYSVEDKAVSVVRWRDESRMVIGVGTLDGLFYRLWLENTDLKLADVVHQNDPRWPWLRDRLIFGKKGVTSQPTTQSAD